MELGGRQHGEPPWEPRGKPVARPWQEQASAFTARQRCRQRRLEQQRVPRARECMSPALIRACARTRKQGPSATLHKKNAPSSPLSLRSRFAVFSSLSSISHRNTHETRRLSSRHAFQAFPHFDVTDRTPTARRRRSYDRRRSCLSNATPFGAPFRRLSTLRRASRRASVTLFVDALRRPSTASKGRFDARQRPPTLFFDALSRFPLVCVCVCVCVCVNL